ncbi:hypothetical protein [Stieleria varia]|uniref:Uncharacterized protein n=1 Tax=Stieleria varia TaxID=2528005 RepID=A0A5C6AFN1_9BACT|nr:hypothetical protein [Stieleria varia]TWT98236.1 hypothetical protein Pla52n_47460 [Stieleria varia]
MLTIEHMTDVLAKPAIAHNETLPSDDVISRRVERIRAQWSEAERVARKEEAERRLEALLDTLMADHAA